VTDADRIAAYVQRRRIEIAHHEAGHAVAAVLCGGTVHHLKLAVDLSDAGLLDPDRELIGVTRLTSASRDAPFVSFAGPWAQWRHGTETGSDDYDTDLSDWLHLDDEITGRDDPHGDYTAMDFDNLSDELIDVWTRELERLWPMIAAVAALALDGQPVNTAVIELLGERLGL
jgi:hypothetical protein